MGGVFVRLLTRINLWLIGSFAVFLAGALLLTRGALLDEARDDAIGQARLLLDAAQAAREYTSREVAPPLSAALALADASAEFNPQMVPAYAATQVFESLRARRPAYVYREAVLNPSNPRDRALAWEADVIQHFRQQPTDTEFSRDRATELGPSLYVARPIRIDEAGCLVCHDTPARAPASVLRRYGSANGFGWQLRETVGAQIVSVPIDTALAHVNRTIGLVAAILTALFVLLFAIVNLVVRTIVLRPIATLADAAERISLGKPITQALDVTGADEISSLSRAFNRMRTSVEKSVALLRQTG
jgi:protein-histidine pros-kinase